MSIPRPTGGGSSSDDPPAVSSGDLIADAAQTLGSALDGSGQLGAEALIPFRTLANYITCKCDAMRDRARGYIDNALRAESLAESCYKQLPKEWRW